MVHVLVVDDERDFADLLAQRLSTRGIHALSAYNGQDALSAARTQPPEVVVLDVSMPDLNGLETLEALKAINPHIEVILLTADATLATAVTGMKLGASDYLIKPTEIDTVVAAIGEAEARRVEGLSRQRMAETAKLAALGELATGVAHEINNPVQIMVNETGWIQELLDEADMSAQSLDEIRESLNQIRTQAQRCKAITSKLLTLRCSLDTQSTSTDLPALVQEILAHRQERVDRLKVCIVTDWPADLPRPGASQNEWEQILANLVDNALDALEPQGGTLTVGGQVDGQQLEISVADTGCGIEAHLLTRIFEPFFSTKDVGKGIGLGLAICHGIIEAMGGSIAVRSTPGHGSVFTLKVPMAVHARIEHTTPDGPATAKEDKE